MKKRKSMLDIYSLPERTWRSKIMYFLARIFGKKYISTTTFNGWATTIVYYKFRGIHYVTTQTQQRTGQ